MTKHTIDSLNNRMPNKSCQETSECAQIQKTNKQKQTNKQKTNKNKKQKL